MSETDDLYRKAFESAADGVLIVDANGTIAEANPAVERLFGYARDDLVGSGVELLVVESHRSAHVDQRARYMQDPEVRPMGVGLSLRGRRKDGTEIPVEISLSPLERGNETWVIAVVRDITEQQRLRDFGAGALRASEEERQRIARELHDDTAQQLATILVRLQLLEQSSPDPYWSEAVDQVRMGVKACAEGVRRIARGLRPPELQDAGLVAAVRSHVRAVAEGSGVSIDLDLDPVDPFLSPEGKLVLYRIVQEAVSNAVRHASPQRVGVRMRSDGARIQAVVEDNGEGFFLDAIEHGDLGGLGLVGMRERAGMVGGRLDIESRPGEGTRVTLIIPIESKGDASRA